MKKRLEAAAEAITADTCIDVSDALFTVWMQEIDDHAGTVEEVAAKALIASDAVMFSDEAIERVAVALWNHDFPSHPINDVSELLEWTRGRRLEQARLMVAALKGDQP